MNYASEYWNFNDGSMLVLDAVLSVHVSDIQVTLVDVHHAKGGRVQYWQRTALIEWVGNHQAQLRRLVQQEAVG